MVFLSNVWKHLLLIRTWQHSIPRYSIAFSQGIAAIIIIIIMCKFCCSEHGIPQGKCLWFGSKFPNRINYFQCFKRDCWHVPLAVERHAGRVIHLEYVGEGEITETILLVGKVKFCTIAVLSFCVHFKNFQHGCILAFARSFYSSASEKNLALQ